MASEQELRSERKGAGRESERLRRENEELRRQLDEKQRELAEKQHELTEKQRELTDKQRELTEKQRELGEKRREIEDLKHQLAVFRRNSTNSSKPPSSDGLAGGQRQRGRKRKSRRKAGGQPGHRGHHRALVPSSQVHQVEVVLPGHCGHCGEGLPQQEEAIQRAGEPRRHQVTEIPPLQAYIIEYQFPHVVCGQCGKKTQAAVPKEIAGQFGVQLTALIAYWTVVCRMPRRVVEAMLADVLGIEISLGSTQKAWEEVSEAVAEPVRELEKQLPQQAVLNVDETGWRNSGERRWMWVLVAQGFVFYIVSTTRAANVLAALLGAVFRGILCCDRWVVYLTYHEEGRMQLCWAHLKRTILGIAEDARSRSAQKFCRDALAILARLFRLWYRFRGDPRDRRGNPQPLDRGQMIVRSIPLQKSLFALAEAHLEDGDAEVRNLAKALYVHSHRLFTFLEEDGVEPTNNAAERSLRTAVQWRKISFGNRSQKGEMAVSRLLTVTQTCKKQQRHVLGYLTEALRCHRRRVATPSLLS